MRIDDLLDLATPPPRPAPTGAAVQVAASARRAHRRRARIAASSAALLVGVAATAAVWGRPGQQVEAQQVETLPAGPDPSAPTGRAAAVGADQGTSAAGPSGGDAGPAVPPSQTRWFLVPPAEVELRSIDDGHVWSQAQGEADRLDLVVTTNVADQSRGGQAWVYHLDYVGVEITDGPEELTETFHDEVIGGRTVQVGSDADTGSVKVFAQWEPGIVAVVGKDLTEEQALAVALAAGVENGSVVLDEQRLPDGVAVAPNPERQATDHTTTLTWSDPARGDELVRLSMRPGTLAGAKLWSGGWRDAVPLTVRSVPGVFYAAVRDQDPATLVWAEDGYQLSLSVVDDRQDRTAEELATVAGTLARVQQPTLIERFDDGFMRQQVAIVGAWLDATPLPEGWDPDRLVHGVPAGEATTASYIRQFLGCAWGAEWLDALRQGDQARQQAALAVLAARPDWPVFRAEAAARATQEADYEEQLGRAFERELDLLTGVDSVDDVDTLELDVGCSFEVPHR